MEVKSVCWIFAVLAFFALLHQGSAIRCWSCSSKTDAQCENINNSSGHHLSFHTKDCEENQQYPQRHVCRKIVQTVYGNREIVRSCILPTGDVTDGPCSQMSPANHIVIESCHVCDKDLCNSATSVSVTHLLYITAFTFLTLGFFGSNKV